MVSPQLYRRAIPAAARITRWTARDGWTLRRFDWPAKGRARGRMLFQGGRGDIFEKYLEAFAHWQAQGWSITSFDWRGQGGSGRLSLRCPCRPYRRLSALCGRLSRILGWMGRRGSRSARRARPFDGRAFAAPRPGGGCGDPRCGGADRADARPAQPTRLGAGRAARGRHRRRRQYGAPGVARQRTPRDDRDAASAANARSGPL